MRLRVPAQWLVVGWLGANAVLHSGPIGAAERNHACELLTPSELESVLGASVTLSGGSSMSGGKAEMCTGRASTATILLRLATGLDPGRDRTGTIEKAGIELFRKMGANVDVQAFGPITCSTIEPPPAKAHSGFNTTCTVSKETAVSGVEVTAKTQKEMVSIDRLRPLAEKMAGRF